MSATSVDDLFSTNSFFRISFRCRGPEKLKLKARELRQVNKLDCRMNCLRTAEARTGLLIISCFLNRSAASSNHHAMEFIIP